MLIIPFSKEYFKCPKCLNDHENSVSYVEAGGGDADSPKIEHLSVTCERCGFCWISETANVDIEQEWDDRDKFSTTCPKCTDDSLKMKYCHKGDRFRRCQEEHTLEHLHCECEVCEFKWISIPADGVPIDDPSKKKEPELPKEEPKKALQAQEAKNVDAPSTAS